MTRWRTWPAARQSRRLCRPPAVAGRWLRTAGRPSPGSAARRRPWSGSRPATRPPRPAWSARSALLPGPHRPAAAPGGRPAAAPRLRAPGRAPRRGRGPARSSRPAAPARRASHPPSPAPRRRAASRPTPAAVAGPAPRAGTMTQGTAIRGTRHPAAGSPGTSPAGTRPPGGLRGPGLRGPGSRIRRQRLPDGVLWHACAPRASLMSFLAGGYPESRARITGPPRTLPHHPARTTRIRPRHRARTTRARPRHRPGVRPRVPVRRGHTPPGPRESRGGAMGGRPAAGASPGTAVPTRLPASSALPR